MQFFENLNVKKFLFLEFILLSPTGIFALFQWYLGMPVLALTVYMLISCLVLPAAYILIMLGKISSEAVNMGGTFANMYLGIDKQLKYGFLGFFLSGGIMFNGVFFSLKYLKIWQFSHVVNLWLPDTEIIVLSIILLLLHPFVEEFLWRTFAQVAFVGGMTYDHPSELICWWIAFHYAIVYVFIFADFVVNWYMSFLCALPFLLVARKFTLMRHYGLLTSIIAHTGLNLGFVVALNVYYWIPLPIAQQ